MVVWEKSCTFAEKFAGLDIHTYIFRGQSLLRHLLTARHTRGNGIHSPRLFYIANTLFYDTNAYYCFGDIERQRERLKRASRAIQVTDFGTGQSEVRTISSIARRSLANRREGQVLFRLVEYLKPQTVIELGTSLGITTAYLGKGCGMRGAVLHTFEGSPSIGEVAQDVWQRLQLTGIRLHIGNIDHTLGEVLASLEHVDFAFLDANHTEEATLRYFSQIAEKCTAQSVVVLDDIHYSRGMARAWKAIKQDSRVRCTMDVYHFGIVFFDPQYLRKHYILTI